MSTPSIHNPPCPFCDTAEKYRYIEQLDDVKAMYPKNPVSAYHVLVMPMRHVAHIDELTAKEWANIGSLIQLLAEKAKTNLPEFIGYNLLSNNGDERVSQRVKHGHVHVFLRVSNELIDPLVKREDKEPRELNEQEQRNLEVLKSWFVSGKVN